MTAPQLETAPRTAHLADILEYAGCVINDAAEFPRAAVVRVDGGWYAVVFTAPNEVRPQDIETGIAASGWGTQEEAAQAAADRTRWARVEAGRISSFRVAS